jgi:Alr-MurF fusion protein
VNLDAMVHNLNYYRSKLEPGTKTMAMVKAFSYGNGSFEIANLLQFNRIDYLAVAYADEGIELRKAGISLPIMVMNPEEDSFDLLINHRLEPEIFSFRVMEMLERSLTGNPPEPGEIMKVHIKLDTGMHRLGFESKDLGKLTERLAKTPLIRVESVFSHLAASEDPAEDDFTRKQISLFNGMADIIRADLGYSFLRHIQNSAGVTRFPDSGMDMIRLGIGLYGVGFDKDEQSRLRNVSTLKSTISQIKQIREGDTIGYNRKGIAVKDTWIAVIPIGYADGLNRRLSNGRGRLFIHGMPAPFIGNISMDTCMVDITDIVRKEIHNPVKEGDEVIVFGDLYPITQLAQDMETIPYEILTSISRRVKRVYFHE